jgi:tRNA (guanine37-N1)-methyltransferase
MRIDILSGVPELLESPLNYSIIKRAREGGIAEIIVHNLRDFSRDKHRKIDDYAFGGEAGMVLSVEPIDIAIQNLKEQRQYDEIIFTSPDGEPFTQKIANELSSKINIIILCGHYKGVDQRVRDHLVTREISIGDYVLSGGELAASVIVDSIVRLIPGVLSDETSALTDSYQDGILSPPVYTRPATYKGWKVPDILLSGNTAEIEKWKMEESLNRTRILRPDLYKKLE